MSGGQEDGIAVPEIRREGNCKIYYPFKVFCLAAFFAGSMMRRFSPILLLMNGV